MSTKLLGKEYWINPNNTDGTGILHVDQEETGNDLSEYNPQGRLEDYKLKIVPGATKLDYKLEHSGWGPTAQDLFKKLVFVERSAVKDLTFAVPQYLVSKGPVELLNKEYKLLRAEIQVLTNTADGKSPDLMIDSFYWSKKVDGKYPNTPVYRTRYWWRGD